MSLEYNGPFAVSEEINYKYNSNYQYLLSSVDSNYQVPVSIKCYATYLYILHTINLVAIHVSR